MSDPARVVNSCRAHGDRRQDNAGCMAGGEARVDHERAGLDHPAKPTTPPCEDGSAAASTARTLSPRIS